MDEKELEALKAANPKAHEAYVKLQGELKTAKETKTEPPKTEPPKTDPKEEKKEEDLREKIAKEKVAANAKVDERKAIEKVLRFNLGIGEFVKTNKEALPGEFNDLLTQAEKENYDTAQDKANAIKSAFVQSFFAVQANVDFLTATQKEVLNDYLKLTKKGREDKAEAVYENLFEPAFETFKRVKKAEELGRARSGFASSSKQTDGYKQRLMAGSRKTYLNEKQ